MNPRVGSTGDALLGTLRTILAELGWQADFDRHSQGAEAVVKVRTRAARAVSLLVFCQRELRPVTFAGWAQPRAELAAKRRATPVLGMPRVSERMAELCRGAGWSWFDLAGNCRIDVPGLLHIEKAGRPPVRRSPRRGANLGTSAASRVVRVLVSPGHAGCSWKQRDLQATTCWRLGDEAPVSLGLVNKVVRHLVDEGFVERSDEDGVRVRDPAGLLAAWTAAYRFDRHARHGYFTLMKEAALGRALYAVASGAGDAVAYAAFSAAERQAPHVRQPKTWLYVRAAYLEAFARHAQANEVDSGENVVVLVPDDPGVFLAFDADARVGDRTVGCTDPVQTYVDLMHCGGRGEEAARAVFEQRIRPAWQAAGVL